MKDNDHDKGAHRKTDVQILLEYLLSDHNNIFQWVIEYSCQGRRIWNLTGSQRQHDKPRRVLV